MNPCLIALCLAAAAPSADTSLLRGVPSALTSMPENPSRPTAVAPIGGSAGGITVYGNPLNSPADLRMMDARLLASAPPLVVRPRWMVDADTTPRDTTVRKKPENFFNRPRRPDPKHAPDRLFGEDKFKHYFVSFIATALAQTTARLAGAGHRNSVAIGAATGMGLGVAKELHDRRDPVGQPSFLDLAWDAAGVGSAVVVANQAR